MIDQLRLLWDMYPEWQLAIAKVGSYALLYVATLVVATIVKSFRASETPPPFLDRIINTATLILLGLLAVGTIARLVSMSMNPLYLFSITHWIVYGAMVLLDLVLLLLLASALRSTRVGPGRKSR